MPSTCNIQPNRDAMKPPTASQSRRKVVRLPPPTAEEDKPAVPLPSTLPPVHWPDEATVFSAEEIHSKVNKLNASTTVLAAVHHPLHAVVEYPETTASSSDRIAHIFPVDPNAFRHPILNVQYSLLSAGAKAGIKCHLLKDDDGSPAECRKRSYQCELTHFTRTTLLPNIFTRSRHKSVSV